MDTILAAATEMLDEIVEIRRDIHRHPELGNQEFRTSALVQEKLKEIGVDEIILPGSTAVVAVIKGRKGEGKTVALRCDMDALPVTEESGVPFASENEGKMHACGHDLHTSMMIGNARLLCDMRDDFAGTVKLIFEPSEEIQPGGARPIIESGAVDDVDAFFGMHVTPSDGDVGQVLLRKGSVTTSADVVVVDVHGMAGHGSQPHKALDAILAACQINVLFQQVQSRNVDPLDTVIFTMNTIKGGVKDNVIPAECSMMGSLRCYTPETREIATQKIYDICKGVETISGCKVDAEVRLGYDACINNDDLVDLLYDTYVSDLGEDSCAFMNEPMGFSEDYSFFSTVTGKPSVLMFLKAGHIDGCPVSTLHSSDITFDETAIPHGMAAMTHAALAFLED